MIKQMKQMDWQTFEKVAGAALKMLLLAFAPLAGVVAYQGKEVLQIVRDHEIRIVKVEADRYTINDARRDRIDEREDLREFIRLNLDPIRKSLEEIKSAVKENRDARYGKP